MSRRNISGKCSSSGNGKSFKSLKELVDEFLSWLPHEKDEHNHIQKCSLPLVKKDIIEAAGCIRYDGKMSSHQCRVGTERLNDAGKLLAGVKDKINKSRNFADLHDEVESTIINTNCIGPLAVYDISVRLGRMKGVEPNKVYLHAGTRDGARFVLKKGAIKKPLTRKTFRKSLVN